MTVYQTKQARVIYVDVRYAIEILCKENSNLNTIFLARVVGLIVCVVLFLISKAQDFLYKILYAFRLLIKRNKVSYSNVTKTNKFRLKMS